MTSNQSNEGYQGSSFKNRAANSGAAQPGSDRPVERFHLKGTFEGQIFRDTRFKVQDDENGEGASKVDEDAQKKRDERKKDAERKREERKKMDAEGNMHYIVTVPKENRAVQATMKAVAESSVGDFKLYSAVAVLAENETLPEIVNSIVKTRGFGQLMVELSEREDLREFANSAASDGELFSLLTAVGADHTLREILRTMMAAPDLARLLIEIVRRDDLRALAETVASNEELSSVAQVLMADVSLQKIVRSASTAPGLVRLLLEISRRADLRKLAEAASANAALAGAFSDLAGAEENLVRSMVEIIGNANRVATDDQTRSLVTEAVAAALGDPEATVKTVAIRQAGGVRAKILTWLLNVG